MNIIIAGIGKVGATLLGKLAGEGHDLTLIDLKKNVLEASCEGQDAMGVAGNCASAKVRARAWLEGRK